MPTGEALALPLTIRWDPPPRAGRTLFVVCAYHGRDRDESRRGLIARLEGTAARGHRIVHRDHYANPRSLAYMARLVEQTLAEWPAGSCVDLVIDDRLGRDEPLSLAPLFGRVETANVADPGAWRVGLLGESSSFDEIVLVYADALGLGCQAIERRALAGHPSVLVITGRGRAFRVDGRWHRRLAVHRWLASTRFVERLLAAAVRPVAAGLAAWDRLAGSPS